MRDDFEGEPWAWDKLPAKHRKSWDTAAAAVIAHLAASHDLTPETMPAKLQLAYDRLYEAGKREPGAPPGGAAPAEAPAAEFDAAAASFEPDIARDGLDLDVGCRDTLHGCADAVRERLAPQWAALAARLAGAEGMRDLFGQRLADAQAALDAAGYGGGPHDAAIRAMAAERDRLAGASEQLDEIAAMVDAAPRGASAEQLAIVLRAIRDVATAALGGASDAG